MDERPDVNSALRDEAFNELEHVAFKAGSYARSLGEAAYRGDDRTVGVHLQQLRLCVLAMIRTFKEAFDGQGVPAAEGPPRSHRQDQRPGDGVA